MNLKMGNWSGETMSQWVKELAVYLQNTYTCMHTHTKTDRQTDKK